jgi:hypothetical protein
MLPQDAADVVLDAPDEHPASIGPTASATAAPAVAPTAAVRHRARIVVRPTAVNSRTFAHPIQRSTPP